MMRASAYIVQISRKTINQSIHINKFIYLYTYLIFQHITQKDEMDDGDLDDDMQEAPLQLAIKTKYVQFMGSNHKF